jgi:hypothetical protein
MKKTLRSPKAALAASLLLALVVSAPSFVFAYALIGGALGISTTANGYQRDVRVWNNSPDVASNNNVTADPNYPGALGAVLSVWKGAKAWASDNPLANKNFDYDFQAGAPISNPADANTVGWGTAGCSGGVLAYTETPISDGWRIVMCDSWTWADGPGAIGGTEFDIQSVAAHELGHALGLGHSNVNCGLATQATMCPAIGNGSIVTRDIVMDDADGLQAVYGVKPANKPVITSLSGSFNNGGTLIITGTSFAATVNVKFSAGTGQNTGSIPGTVYGVASSAGGTQVSVVIPANAVDGNVIVWEPSLNVMSNAFPIDINYVPPSPPSITSFSPTNVQAFQGGTVTMTGTGFLGATQVDVGGTLLNAPGGFTVVSDNTITFTAPNGTALGPVAVTVTAPPGTSVPNNTLTYVETVPCKLATPSIVLSNQFFTWNWGAGANDTSILIAATDSTTNTFGTPYDILVNYLIVSTPSCNAAGLGTQTITFPPGLGGITFYSQVAALDEVTGGLNSASNITSTFVLF